MDSKKIREGMTDRVILTIKHERPEVGSSVDKEVPRE